MANKIPTITLKVIGTVQNDVKQPPKPGYKWDSIVSEIIVDSSLTEALDRVEAFSHIFL